MSEFPQAPSSVSGKSDRPITEHPILNGVTWPDLALIPGLPEPDT